MGIFPFYAPFLSPNKPAQEEAEHVGRRSTRYLPHLVGHPSYLGEIYIGHAVTARGACDTLRRYLGIGVRDVELLPHLSDGPDGFHFATTVMRMAKVLAPEGALSASGTALSFDTH